ncbi:MAG: aminoacyl-tRNA hydrolase [Candidatus Falkowbacteria bacterium]|nr:aminoacyl-tRNA hydrolase [Candidatus Falkowbacteria bacterium]
MRIIIGLGNPDKVYEKTRHNVGFVLVDALAKSKKLDFKFSKKFNALVAEDGDIFLVKPETYMNNSGLSVRAILAYYQLLPKQFGLIAKNDIDLTNELIVVHDDLDIEIGKYKISLDSRSAGHRGVESIINQLKTKNFKRIRIGIKSPLLTRMAVKDFVLKKFSAEENLVINAIIKEIIKKELTELV